MKTIKKYLFLGALSALFWSCANDDTDLGGRDISKITIDSKSIQEDYNLKKNDVLTIDPIVSQSMSGKDLSYEWEIDHEVVYNEKVFNHTWTQLGTFYCRLIVSNEDGKAFYPFVVNVNTPYEEGITILSKDANGKSMISFMLHNLDGTPDQFYEGDMFSLNNPEIQFASHASDMIITNGSLVIACQGSEASGDPSAIYYLNSKTLDIENFVEMPEYPDFRPVKMFVTSVSQAGASYPVLCQNGKMYDFAAAEGTVVPSTKYPSTYSLSAHAIYDGGGGGNSFNFYFWDKELEVPVTMDRNSVFYCINDYTLATSRSNVNSSNNIFAKDKDQAIAVFVPQFTSRELLRGKPDVYFVTTSNGDYRRVAFSKDIWDYNSNTGQNVFTVKQTFSSIGQIGEVPFEEGLPMIASNTNKMVFYGYGNKIYMWPYQQNSLNYATVLTELGNANSVISAISMSEDQSTLYVASYDPTQSGLNGSCHLVTVSRNASTDDVTVTDITNHENISYQPVKIMYKAK